jgi:hypothetical protein
MEKSEIIKKLKSLKLNLEVHPENEPNSEFENRISSLNEIIESIEKCECKNEWIEHIDNFSDRMRCTVCGKRW